MLFLEEKGGGLKAKEHHPNRETRGWQHHVVRVLCCRIDGIMRRENDVGILKQHLKTSVRKLKLALATALLDIPAVSIPIASSFIT